MRTKNEGALGFQDIPAFNLAMLSKQAWRLWERPEYLCARILRAKYYNNSTVLDAKPKAAMSYTWRSILKGCSTVEERHDLESRGWQRFENLERPLATEGPI